MGWFSRKSRAAKAAEKAGLGSGLVIVRGRVYRNCMQAGKEGLGRLGL